MPKKVDLPTLVVWGDRETHLDPELATPPADWVSDARVEHVPEGGTGSITTRPKRWARCSSRTPGESAR